MSRIMVHQEKEQRLSRAVKYLYPPGTLIIVKAVAKVPNVPSAQGVSKSLERVLGTDIPYSGQALLNTQHYVTVTHHQKSTVLVK